MIFHKEFQTTCSHLVLIEFFLLKVILVDTHQPLFTSRGNWTDKLANSTEHKMSSTFANKAKNNKRIKKCNKNTF